MEDHAEDAAALRPSLFPALSREEASRLLESHKEAAIRSLVAIDNAALKGLLRRVIGKIFNETEFNAWCLEIQGERKQP